MPRNVFEEIDARAARAVGRLLEEPAKWLPMLTRAQGGAWTTDQNPKPDPSRPVREGLPAIVTWASTVVDMAPGSGGSSAATGRLVIDIGMDQFPDGSAPRKGDRLFLAAQKPGERMVEVLKVSDDGSARALYTCQIVKESAL